MLNKVVLQGRLGSDPELKTTPSGVEVVTLNVACDRDRKDAGGERQTDWISVQAWRQTAKFISQYFSKGSSILVEGRLQTRSYTDKNGNKRTAFDVVADSVHFFGGKAESGSRSQTSYGAPDYGTTGADAFQELSEDDGTLPF